MFKNGLLSKVFIVIFLTLFTASFSYAGDGEDNDKSTTIPANAHQVGETWECDKGFFRIIDATGCLPVPDQPDTRIPDPLPPEKVPETSYALIALIVFILFMFLFKIERNPRPSIKLRSFKKNQHPKPRPKPPPHPTNTNVKEHSSDSEWHLTQQTETIKSLKSDLSTLKKDINDMSQTFMTLKTSLDQKDEEISRYKNGYDATIFKNFLLRFTRVDKVIKEYIGDNKIDLNGLQDIQIQMDDALAECDVEIYIPEIGLDYKTTAGLEDNPEIRETTEKSKDATIAEILMPGYRRKLPTDDYQIIVEAKVAIHVYKKNN
jgi:hypothetical protein